MAALANITASAPTEQENPINRIHRLASELSEALNWYGGGAWSAHVYPSEARRGQLFGLTQDVEPRCRSFH